jgi:hypothetical protein
LYKLPEQNINNCTTGSNCMPKGNPGRQKMKREQGKELSFMSKGKNTKYNYYKVIFVTDKKDKLRMQEKAKENNVTLSDIYRKITAFMLYSKDSAGWLEWICEREEDNLKGK